jgi:hypothetical protein
LKDPSLDPAAHIRERRTSGKRMGGWGIFLARKMVDEVTFNRRGNIVFLTKYFQHLPPPAVPAAGQTGQAIPAVQATLPHRDTTRVLRKTTRLLRKDDPTLKAREEVKDTRLHRD